MSAMSATEGTKAAKAADMSETESEGEGEEVLIHSEIINHSETAIIFVIRLKKVLLCTRELLSG